jgi:hypothetical protein
LIKILYEKDNKLLDQLISATPVGQFAKTLTGAAKELGVGELEEKKPNKKSVETEIDADLINELIYYLIPEREKYKSVLEYIKTKYKINYKDKKYKQKFKHKEKFEKLIKKIPKDILEKLKKVYKKESKFYLEFSIKDLWSSSANSGSGNAVSPRNKEFYAIRKQNNNTFFLTNVTYDSKKGSLLLKVKITPTYKPDEVINITKDAEETTGTNYEGLIEFSDLNELFNREDWNSLEFKDKRDIVYKILDTADVKIFVNDPSFLYQGSWKQLDEVGASLYSFPNLPDKGIWKKRHQNYSVHLTKHLVGLFAILKPNADKIIKAIDEELR